MADFDWFDDRGIYLISIVWNPGMVCNSLFRKNVCTGWLEENVICTTKSLNNANWKKLKIEIENLKLKTEYNKAFMIQALWFVTEVDYIFIMM